jgi:hypothetical protein
MVPEEPTWINELWNELTLMVVVHDAHGRSQLLNYNLLIKAFA